MVPRHVMAKRAQSPRPVRPGVEGRPADHWPGQEHPNHGAMCSCPSCRVRVVYTPPETDPSNGPRK